MDVSWIVTLDVLKYDEGVATAMNKRLNSNIRCIEMRNRRQELSQEMSWIVTLDVLKFTPF